MDVIDFPTLSRCVNSLPLEYCLVPWEEDFHPLKECPRQDASSTPLTVKCSHKGHGVITFSGIEIFFSSNTGESFDSLSGGHNTFASQTLSSVLTA